VFKRDGGGYVVVFRDTSGKQRKRVAKTLAEARTLKATLKADVRRGEWMEESRVKFRDYATTWLDTYAGRTSRGIREETLAEYRRVVERDAIPFFGSMPLAAIRPMDLKRYALHLASRGLKPNTLRLAIGPVRAMLATAVEDGLIRSNPAARLRLAHAVPVKEEQQEKAKALTEDELRQLIEATPDDWRLLVEFLAVTGLRISEALALSWADLDLGRRRVMVRRRVNAGKLAPPKTRFGRRDVPLSQGMARKLWLARAGQPDHALVFAAHDGGYLDRFAVYRVVKAAAKAGHVPWVGLHGLRHSCASILFRRGLNAKQVQSWLGHHSAAFTLATYVHLIDDDFPDAEFLDDLLTPPSSDAIQEDARESIAVGS
jgi:integrase